MAARGLTVALVACLAGCKAAPGKPTSFFGGTEGMEEVPEVQAFHRTWVKPGVKWERYRKLAVAPVNTQFLRQRQGWQRISFAEYDAKGVERLAAFTRQAFLDAHRANTHPNRLEVVDEPDGQTLVLELAITELVPTKAWLNVLSVAGIQWAIDKGLVAVEGRLRDGATGEIVARFADREAGKENILNVKDFTWYSHAKAVLREWAEQSVAITNAEEGEQVKDSAAFEFKVW